MLRQLYKKDNIGGYYSAKTVKITRGSKLIRNPNYVYDGLEMQLELETENGSSYLIALSEDLREWNQEVVIEGDSFNELIKFSTEGYRKNSEELTFLSRLSNRIRK